MTEVSSPTSKDAFISYNRSDEKWVSMLAERIERETADGFATGKKLSAFFAAWDIDSGQNIVNRINDGLRRARIFIPVMSPEFFASGWTNLEWTDQVALDPKNASGRIVPIFLRDISIDGKQRISIPAPFTVLNRLDFRNPDEFEASFDELIRILRGWPKQRGQGAIVSVVTSHASSISASSHEYALPSATRELLLSNFIKMEQLPDKIWSGATEARKPADVRRAVNTNEAFLLRDKKLFAFSNVADPHCSLYPIVTAETVGPPDARSSFTKCEEGKRRYTALLNNCLQQHLFERKIGRDERGRFYFWPNLDSEGARVNREFAVGQERAREVAARKLNPADGSHFWVHYAARIRFEAFGDAIFLHIEPTYIFTKDGREALDGKSVGKLSVQWTGKQQNPDVLRAVLFWTRVLADGKAKIRIAAGAADITAASLPATAAANFGVAGDYIRVQALLQEPEPSLDEIVNEMEVVERDDAIDEPSETEEEDET